MGPSHEDRDLSDEELEDELEAIFKAFNEHVEEFAQDHDLSDGVLSVLMQRMSLSLRMAGYMTSVEKPPWRLNFRHYTIGGVAPQRDFRSSLCFSAIIDNRILFALDKEQFVECARC